MMEIEREDDVTGIRMRDLRTLLGQTQEVFWGAVCVSVSSGSNYENGLFMPETVRRLLYLHHVLGIPTNACPEDLGRLITTVKSRRDFRKAKEAAQKASDILNRLTGE